VVLEDAPAGIKAGRAAGVKTVLGVGERAAQGGPDLLVADLSCVRWVGSGLEVS
jgi:sugar-phosphatase